MTEATKLIIANDKGGVGKTIIAQVCILRLIQARCSLRVVEYDSKPRLARLLGNGMVLSYPVLQGHLDASDAVVTGWETLGRWLDVDRNVVADFGPQAWTSFACWANRIGLAGAVDTRRVTVIVPVTADVDALVSAYAVLDEMSGFMPLAKALIVLNERDGHFDGVKQTTAYRSLEAIASERAVPMIRLPTLPRDGYSVLAGAGLRFDQIVQASPEALTSRYGLPSMAAEYTIQAVAQWFADVQAELVRVQCLPS
jgi:hypothetical protein